MDNTLLAEISNSLRISVRESQVRLVEEAMLIEAPDVAALGFDGYRSQLAMDNEGPNMEMVMLYREADQPYQPIVLLLTDFSQPSTNPREDYKLSVTVTPVVGEAGWQQFQAQRARNNTPEE